MDEASSGEDSAAQALHRRRILEGLPRAELERKHEALCAEAAAEQAQPATPLSGACEDMCPHREALSRVLAGERVTGSALDVSTALSLTKRFVRSAAGAPPPLAAEVRSPQALAQSLSLLLRVPVDAGCYSALENRIRAVRSDLLVQQVAPRLSLSLLGRIARWYIGCMYTLRDSAADQHPIIDQARKVLSTILSVHAREDGRTGPGCCKGGDQCPLLDEFHGYHILCNIDDPFLRSSCFAWSLPYTRQCLSLLLDFQSLNFYGFFRHVPDLMASAFVLHWEGVFRTRTLEMITKGLRTAEPEAALEQMLGRRPQTARVFSSTYLHSGNIDFRISRAVVRAYVLGRIQACRLYAATVRRFCADAVSAGARRRARACEAFRAICSALVRQMLFSIIARRFIKDRFCIRDRILIVHEGSRARTGGAPDEPGHGGPVPHALLTSLCRLAPVTTKYNVDFCTAERLSEDTALRFALTIFLVSGKALDSAAAACRMLNCLANPGPEDVAAAVERGGVRRLRLSDALSGRPLRMQLAIISGLRRHMGRDYEHTVQAVLDGRYFRDRVIYAPAKELEWLERLQKEAAGTSLHDAFVDH